MMRAGGMYSRHPLPSPALSSNMFLSSSALALPFYEAAAAFHLAATWLLFSGQPAPPPTPRCHVSTHLDEPCSNGLPLEPLMRLPSVAATSSEIVVRPAAFITQQGHGTQLQVLPMGRPGWPTRKHAGHPGFLPPQGERRSCGGTIPVTLIGSLLSTEAGNIL